MYVLMLIHVLIRGENGPNKSLTLAFMLTCPEHPQPVYGCEGVTTQAVLLRHISLTSSHHLSPSTNNAATHCRNYKLDTLCQWIWVKQALMVGFCLLPTDTLRLFSISVQIIYNLFWTPSSLRLIFFHCNCNNSSLCVTQSYFRLIQEHKSAGLTQVHC